VRTAYAGQSVTLHALAAQAAGDVSYRWEQIGGAKVALAGADTPSLGFVAPALTGSTHELLSFKLTVTDVNGTGTPTKVAVTVEPAENVIVKALTKDATVLAGQPVSLHARGSGASSPAYQWTQVAPASPTVALTGAGTANPSFTAPDVDGLRFVFQVRYADAVSGRHATAKTAVLVRRAPTQVTTDPLQIAGSSAVPPQVLSLQAPEDATAIGGTGVDVARAGRGQFDATGPVDCSDRPGQPMRQCQMGVARDGGGTATVVVTRPDGRKRTIFFDKGKAVSADLSQADGNMNFRAAKSGAGMFLIDAGNERYEFPESVVFGG
jgi:hypothetical protein